MRFQENVLVIGSLILLFAGPVSASAQSATEEDKLLQIVFIDVGQGDSTLVIMPSGKTMLIDGGERNMAQKIISVLEINDIQELDVVVATHPHADHIGGLIGVLNNIPVGTVLDSGQVHTTITFADYLDAIDRNQIPIRMVRDGDVIELDPDVKLEVLNPPITLPEGAHNESQFNNNSVVIKLTFGEFSAIFPGDIEEATEARLAENKDIDVNVLLASHHGSRGANTASYLTQASPEVVIVYAGANNIYGHPHPEAVARIEAANPLHIFRTDLHGDIVLVSNSTHYSIAVSSSDQVVVVPEFHELLLLVLMPMVTTVIIMTRVMKDRWSPDTMIFR